MSLFQNVEDFHPLQDEKLLKKAERIKPVLFRKTVTPVSIVGPAALGRGDQLLLDFGTHWVGHLSLELSFQGSHPDAPAHIRLQFAERLNELNEKPEEYDGWLSASWIQEEIIHVDVLPATVQLPRRYAFRYVQITVLNTSPKYNLVVKCAECTAETAADYGKVEPYIIKNELLNRMDQVSLRTLANCMQEVFEDGPKRDRRLWAGDFRLQALVNYTTFQNNDLVKRCLYLFGGSRFPDGRVSACIFTNPAVEADDTWFFDYSLFFVVALEEYLNCTGDREALEDLYDIAIEQIDLSLSFCDTNGIIGEKAVASCFVDWCEDLEKTACAQAILIYALRYAIKLTERKGDNRKKAYLTEKLAFLNQAARNRFWDQQRACFISNGQVSAASQVWMVLADVAEPAEATQLMMLVDTMKQTIPMTTPYMHHYYISALMQSGLKKKALKEMTAYWGGMLEAGADTFWESWTQENPDASPYGGSAVNSYCHAWSCTPAYLIRKVFRENT